jgi:hypothetical protein
MQFTKEFTPHAHMHHVVIIVIIIIIAKLTLCHSIMSHATLIPYYQCIHVKTTKLIYMTCTLVATNVILFSLEFIQSRNQ